MTKKNRYIWVNGTFVRDSDPALRPATKGLMYGAGCFETLRSYRGKFLHLNLHLDRLMKGMAYLDIDPGEQFLEDLLRDSIQQLLARNGLADQDAIVRIQVSDAGMRGYRPNREIQPNIIITTSPLEDRSGQYRLSTVSQRVIPSASRPADLKLSNTLHYMQAWREAQKNGANDALMLTSKGMVAESAIANIFWKKGDTIFTPSCDCDILPGLVRQIMLELLTRSPNYHVQEAQFRPADLLNADIVWLTNSVRQILPVAGVDDHDFPVETRFYEDLKNAFHLYREVNLS